MTLTFAGALVGGFLDMISGKRDTKEHSEALFSIERGAKSINFPLVRYEIERQNRSNGKLSVKLLSVGL